MISQLYQTHAQAHKCVHEVETKLYHTYINIIKWQKGLIKIIIMKAVVNYFAYVIIENAAKAKRIHANILCS